MIVTENRIQALTTLGAATAILIGTKLAMETGYRILRSDCWGEVSGLTAGEGRSLIFGLAHGDLTVAEIAAAVKSNGPLDDDNVQGQEQAVRPVYIAGYGRIESGATALQFVGPEGSISMQLKPRYTFPDRGIGWNWFVYNFDASPLTTGAIVTFLARNFGLWVPQ